MHRFSCYTICSIIVYSMVPTTEETNRVNILNPFETSILHWIRQTFSCAFLDAVMPYITKFADSGIGWILLALVLLIPRKTRRMGAAMGVALAIGFVTGNLLLKNLVARTRPFLFDPSIELLIAPPHEFSFPSGHTLASFECAVAVFCYRRKWGVAALLFAVLIAFSRLYLQVHYPTDVLYGAILGSLIGYLAYRIVETIAHKHVAKRPQV